MKEINPKRPTEQSPAKVIIDFLTDMLVQERVRKETWRRRQGVGVTEITVATKAAQARRRRGPRHLQSTDF